MKRYNILSIAGVDPSGGAGVIADLKTISAFGNYGMGVITGLTAQNTQGVQNVSPVDPQFVKEQLNSIKSDIKIDAIKIGALFTIEIINVVTDFLRSYSKDNRPYTVLDPVMVATSGDKLFRDGDESAFIELFKCVDVVTPNLNELKVILSFINPSNPNYQKSNHLINVDDLRNMAIELFEYIENNNTDQNITIYAKGGHLDDLKYATDLIITNENASKVDAKYCEYNLSDELIKTNNTHGTGCTLSSALASVRPSVNSWAISSKVAKHYLWKSIQSNDNLNVGGLNEGFNMTHGPVDHLHQSSPMSFVNRAKLITADVEFQIDNMNFIKQIISGDLPKDKFAKYLVQDNIYIAKYGELAKESSKIANDYDEKHLLTDIFGADVTNEINMHNNWLVENGYSDLINQKNPSQITKEYLNHLQTALDESVQQKSLAIFSAALLPCAYLYGEICQKIAQKSQEVTINSNPYQKWIDIYASEDYNTVVQKLIEIVERYASETNSETVEKMLNAYRISSELEYRFFDI